MKKVFLGNLPRKMYQGKECIDWANSMGHRVRFIYNDYSGEILLSKIISSRRMSVVYNNKEFEVDIYHFSEGHLGYILGVLSKKFRVQIGEIFNDSNRNLVILDREYRNIGKHNNIKHKYYKYECNTCGWDDGWMMERQLLTDKQGCSCCSGHTTVEGINDITTTDPWMIKYFQGGYDEAKLYSRQSSKQIYPICPECGVVKSNPVYICTLNRTHSIGCECSDKISYPEKFMIAFFDQLKICYIYQFTKTYADWCSNYKYDFASILHKCIIEVHGCGHYSENNFSKLGGRTLKEEQCNDIQKKDNALRNGIKNYIVIDARYSESEWIKNSIMNSELPKLFNFTEKDIDWKKCNKFAVGNLVKEICIKQNNNNLSVKELSEYYKLSDTTIRSYLKKGTVFGWCDYNRYKEENKKIKRVAWNKGSGKNVEVFKNNLSLGVFSNVRYLLENSIELFNIEFSIHSIYSVLQGRNKQHKGFSFKYVE